MIWRIMLAAVLGFIGAATLIFPFLGFHNQEHHQDQKVFSVLAAIILWWLVAVLIIFGGAFRKSKVERIGWALLVVPLVFPFFRS